MGELSRLLRTNSAESTFTKHALLLRHKLAQLGYPASVFERCFQHRNWANRLQVVSNGLRVGNRPSNKMIIPFKLRYFQGAERLPILRAVRRHASLADLDSSTVTRCWMTSPNLFRIRYEHFF